MYALMYCFFIKKDVLKNSLKILYTIIFTSLIFVQASYSVLTVTPKKQMVAPAYPNVQTQAQAPEPTNSKKQQKSWSFISAIRKYSTPLFIGALLATSLGGNIYLLSQPLPNCKESNLHDYRRGYAQAMTAACPTLCTQQCIEKNPLTFTPESGKILFCQNMHGTGNTPINLVMGQSPVSGN